MQVSSAGDRTEHVNDWSESARIYHCQTFHRGRRMFYFVFLKSFSYYNNMA